MDGAALAKSSIRNLTDLIESDDHTADYQDIRANVSDTLAYLLVQRAEQANRAGDEVGKRKLLEEAVEVFKTIAPKGGGDILFRYAVALNGLDRKVDANLYLETAIRDKGYLPTHELYLVYNFISPDFWEELSKTGTATPTRTLAAPTDHSGAKAKPDACPNAEPASKT
jgi:hypothetical protein